MLTQKGMQKEPKNELLLLKESDQRAVLLFQTGRKKRANALFRKNEKRIKKIITRYGWPGFSVVGKRAARAAWLVVQHMDSNLAFQEKCLKLLQKAVHKKEAEKKYYAYLVDRVRVNRGQKQLYGTQFLYTKGELRVAPLSDPKNLNARRKGAGLSRFVAHRISTLPKIKKK